ncbi:MAG: hypothetical protein ACK4VI_01550 [Alphaproteobacteria bacterium]
MIGIALQIIRAITGDPVIENYLGVENGAVINAPALDQFAIDIESGAMNYLNDFIGEAYPSMIDAFTVAAADGLDTAEIQAFVEIIGTRHSQQLSAEDIDISLDVLDRLGLETTGNAILGMSDILKQFMAVNNISELSPMIAQPISDYSLPIQR